MGACPGNWRSWNAPGAWEVAFLSHDFGASEKSLGDLLPVDMLPVLTFLLGPLPWQFRVLVRAHGVRSLGATGCGTLSAVARLWRVEGNGLVPEAKPFLDLR